MAQKKDEPQKKAPKKYSKPSLQKHGQLAALAEKVIGMTTA
jgi:hypothetical protein